MISADTNDRTGRRTHWLPQALGDVAKDLFPNLDQCGAVFRLARCLSWHDAHTLENIAVNNSHTEAVSFARERLQKSALATRREH
ncbi:MAG: hypothetical protein U1A72_19895 [Sulfuritalea sp.]|nr:hypothetical protein [Sulfuritalea sp.]